MPTEFIAPEEHQFEMAPPVDKNHYVNQVMQEFSAEINNSQNIEVYVDFILQKLEAPKKFIPETKDKKYNRITKDMFNILELELITKGNTSMKERKLLA